MWLSVIVRVKVFKLNSIYGISVLTATRVCGVVSIIHVELWIIHVLV